MDSGCDCTFSGFSDVFDDSWLISLKIEPSQFPFKEVNTFMNTPLPSSQLELDILQEAIIIIVVNVIKYLYSDTEILGAPD